MSRIEAFDDISEEEKKKSHISYYEEAPLKRNTLGGPVNKEYKDLSDQTFAANIALQFLEFYEDGSAEAMKEYNIEQKIEDLRSWAARSGSDYLKKTLEYIETLIKIAKTKPRESAQIRTKLAGLPSFFGTPEGDSFKVETGETKIKETQPAVALNVNKILERVILDPNFSFNNEAGLKMLAVWKKIGSDQLLMQRCELVRERDALNDSYKGKKPTQKE